MTDAVRTWVDEVLRLSDPEAREAVRTLAGEKSLSAAERLQALAEVAPPPLRKEARRALYRLRLAGIEPPPRSRSEPEAPVRVFLSWVDGQGRRLLLALVERPSGGARLAKIVVGEDGLSEPALSERSPGQLRRMFAELEAGGTHLVEFPLPYARALVKEAAARGWPEDPAERAGAEAVLGVLGEPAGSAKHPVYEVLDPLVVKWDPTALAASPRLLEAPELGSWRFPARRMAKWAGRLREIESSPLVLDEATERRRLAEFWRQAVKELFPPEVAARWRRRLEDMAYYFHQRREERLARLALAAALALPEEPRAGKEGEEVAWADHPFLQEVVARSVLAAEREEEEDEEDRPRIIVPRGVGDVQSG